MGSTPTMGTKGNNMKVVINVCFGGFSVSTEAVKWIRKNMPCEHEDVLKGEKYSDGSICTSEWGHYGHSEARSCPSLVAVVEILGEKANGECAELAIIEIPNDVKWHIHEYDGSEHIAEDHRTWG